MRWTRLLPGPRLPSKHDGSVCVTAREAVEGLEDIVDYHEVDTSDLEVMRSWGITNGLYVEGEPYKSYEPPCTSDVLRQERLGLLGQCSC